MNKLPNNKRKFAIYNSKLVKLAFISVLVFFSAIWLDLLKQNPLSARDVTRQSTIYQNPWQYASFPVENFQAYTSGFGYRVSPYTGQRQFHYGLDIAAPLGSYIRNWWTGTVVALSDHTACGTMIQIQSGEWTHIYCHLMGSVESTPNGKYFIDRNGGIVIAMGQTIPAGARIGRIGMTGRTTGPHLHWALKHDNNYVDPAIVLQAMYRPRASLY